MKRAISFVIIFIIFALLYQYTIVYLQNGHDVKYEIESNGKVFKIQENYKKNAEQNRYLFYITVDNTKEYIFNIDNKYNKQKKVIKDIKYFEKDKYTCIYPITDLSKEDFEIQCSDGKEIYSYDYVNKITDISEFLSVVKDKNKYEDKVLNKTKENNALFYIDNFYSDEYLTLYRYKYVNLLNNGKLLNLNFSETDTYFNTYSVYINNYLLIPLVNEKTKEITKYVSIDSVKMGLETIFLETPLSNNIYNIGVSNDKLYVFDLKNKKEFEISPLGGYKVIGSVEQGFKLLEDGKWVEKSITEFTQNKITINEKPKVDLSYEYDEIFETKKAYYIIDNNKLYKIYKDNLNIRVLLLDVSNYKNIKIDNDRVYYINDTELYRYDKYGIKKLVTHNEFKYNNHNIYNVYNK